MQLMGACVTVVYAPHMGQHAVDALRLAVSVVEIAEVHVAAFAMQHHAAMSTRRWRDVPVY